MQTTEILSLDINAIDVNYTDRYCWNNTLLKLSNLKHLYFKMRILLTLDAMFVDINSILESFKPTNLSICCYIDTNILHIDTIPYDLTVFDANMNVTISPHLNLAKTKSIQLFEQKSKGVHTLVVDVQHDSALVDAIGYILLSVFQVFNYFKPIECLCEKINTHHNIEVSDKHIQLAHLTIFVRHTVKHIFPSSCFW